MRAQSSHVVLDQEVDTRFMALALEQAKVAWRQGEVPVGAVVVCQGRVVGLGYNQPVTSHDPSAHAELVAMRAAAIELQNYRLDGCTLYVTLEPCPMCSGAIMQSRLARVVYGAPEPKSGAAGSVVNLFSVPALNSHTQVDGGVLAEPCANLLREFFSRRRSEIKTLRVPLREDALRTPEACFRDLPDYPWQGKYVHDLPALRGLRLHYLDEGARDAATVWLCLHDVPGWSYAFRHMMPVWLNAGHRVVVPDLIGFGRSDKPKKESAHTMAWHRQVLCELVESLDLRGVSLVLHGLGVGMGLTLPEAAPVRYRRVLALGPRPGLSVSDGHAVVPARRTINARVASGVPMPVQSPGTQVGSHPEKAPFPDRGYEAGPRALPRVLSAWASQQAELMRRNVGLVGVGAWQGPGWIVTSEPEQLGEPWMSMLGRGSDEGWQLVTSPGVDKDLTEPLGAAIAQQALSGWV